MNSQELSQLQFTDGKDLSKYLKELARSCGFKICLLDSQKSNRIRFYCSLQQQHKKVQYTKKSGCTHTHTALCELALRAALPPALH